MRLRPSPWLFPLSILTTIALGCGSSSSSEPGNPTDGGDDTSTGGGDTGITNDTGTSPDDTGTNPNDTGTNPGDTGTNPDGSTACDAPTIPSLGLQSIVTGTGNLGSSIFAAQPPGSTDWYVVDQTGKVRIVRGGAILGTVFLDISKSIGTGGVSSLGERGLLSIAFHPNYATNGRFFIGYTVGDGADGKLGAANTDHVAEYARDTTNPDIANPARVQAIIDLPASASNHNGGTTMFGTDGKLYYGTGDGGGACNDNQPGAPQDVTKLFGKILRFDVDAASPFIPTDGPFLTTTPKGDGRVWHYGLRNPFRWGWDSATNDFYVGDVGQDSYEEHDFVAGNAPGKNFGWNYSEGLTVGTCGNDKQLVGPSPWTKPIVAIDRRSGSTSPFADYQATIGGRVYRGSAIPSLVGVYMFGDYAGHEMGFLKVCGSADNVSPPVAVDYSKFSNDLQAVTAIVYGNDKETYVVYGTPNAKVAKLIAK